MLQMSVKVVGLDQSSMVPVVILTDADERFISGSYRPSEANAIAVVLRFDTPRPLTHDLLLSAIKELGATVERVITELKDDVFYANSIRQNGQTLSWMHALAILLHLPSGQECRSSYLKQS